MRKVVIFDKKKSYWSDVPDLELLNKQIEEMEGDGWSLCSLETNTGLFGAIISFTLLIESNQTNENT